MGTRAHAPGGRRPQVDGAPVIAAFGGVTPEKRIPQVLARVRPRARVAPNARLLLVGETRDVLRSRGRGRRELGVADRVSRHRVRADDADLDAWLEAADVCVCLRWPTARETSASWLRCLAAGKATIITDLSHTVEVPSLDPRTWQVQWAWSPPGTEPPRRRRSPVCVAVDILDEDHSLGLALRRLALDAALRASLGEAAARGGGRPITRWLAWSRDTSVALAAAAAAPAMPPRRRDLPPHLRDSARERSSGSARRWASGSRWPL